jgi:hypothetical protein
MRAAFLVVLALSAPAVAQDGGVEGVLGYAGVLEQDGAPADGVYDFTFHLYDAEVGGAPVWSEAHELLVVEGRFHAVFGRTTPLPSAVDVGGPLWVGVDVEGTALAGRQELLPPPFSLRSAALAAGDQVVQGRLGVGAATEPEEQLTVRLDVDGDARAVAHNDHAGTQARSLVRASAGDAEVTLIANGAGRSSSRWGVPLARMTELVASDTSILVVGTLAQTPVVIATNGVERVRIAGNGEIGVGQSSPSHPLHMASGAYVSAAGVWTDASSGAWKQDVEPLAIDDARTTLAELTPVRFRYKIDPEDEHCGFIAEDVPDLVATPTRDGLSPMDVAAVLARVVQDQEARIAALEARLAERDARP